MSEELSSKERQEAHEERQGNAKGEHECQSEEGREPARGEDVGGGRVWIVVGASSEDGRCGLVGEEHLDG